MSRLTRDWAAEPVSRDQILRRERGQGNAYFPWLADHEQDWQLYPVDPFSAISDGRESTGTGPVIPKVAAIVPVTGAAFSSTVSPCMDQLMCAFLFPHLL